MACGCVSFKGNKIKDIYDTDTGVIVVLNDDSIITSTEFINRYNALMDFFDIQLKEERDNACGRYCKGKA